MFPIFANFWIGSYLSLAKWQYLVPTMTIDQPRYYWKPQNRLKISLSIIITVIVMNITLFIMMTTIMMVIMIVLF